MGIKTGKQVFRHAPCVNCCDCAYFADEYDREYGEVGRTGDDWYTVAPWPQPVPTDPGGHGWETENHKLNIEASKSLIYCKWIHPNINGDDDFSTTIQVNVSGAAPRDNARVCYNYQGTDNYHYVEIEWGAIGSNEGTIRHGVRSDGSDTDNDSATLGPMAPPFPSQGGGVTIRICIDDSGEGDADVTIISNHGSHFTITVPMADSHVALGAGWGTDNTGIVSFDDFRLWDTAIADTDPNCPSCSSTPDDTCKMCLVNHVWYRYKIVIAGLALLDPVGCGECVDLNGTYYVQWTAASWETFGRWSWCWWSYFPPAQPCGIYKLQMVLAQSKDRGPIYGFNEGITVFFGNAVLQAYGDIRAEWYRPLAPSDAKWNCSFVNLLLPPVLPFRNLACDGANSTCKVTAA